MAEENKDRVETDLDLVNDCTWVRGLDASGKSIRIAKEDLANIFIELMPTSYSGWTIGSKLKLTKGACCFMLSAFGSTYLVTSTGSKGASVTKLGGEHSADFREDSSGNVYILAIGLFFIQKIGYSIFNITAEEISDYPPDCTTLVVK